MSATDAVFSLKDDDLTSDFGSKVQKHLSSIVRLTHLDWYE